MNQNPVIIPPIEQAATPRVDVVMGWDDFRFALSELSQNSYGELLDQQWFKLDPLEIFILVHYRMGLDTIVDDGEITRPMKKIMIKMTSCKPTILRHHEHLTRSLDLLVYLITLPVDSKLPDVAYMQCLVCLCLMYPAIRSWDPQEGLRWVALAKYHTTVAQGLEFVAEHMLNQMERRARDMYDEIVQRKVDQKDGGIFPPVSSKIFANDLRDPVYVFRYNILLECYKSARNSNMEGVVDHQDDISQYLENDLNLSYILERIGPIAENLEVYAELMDFLYTYLCAAPDEPDIKAVMEIETEQSMNISSAVEITSIESYVSTPATIEPYAPDDLLVSNSLTQLESATEPPSPSVPEPIPMVWPLLISTLSTLPPLLQPSLSAPIIHTTRICLATNLTRTTINLLQDVLPALLLHHAAPDTAVALLSLLATAFEHGYTPLDFACQYLPNLMGPLVGIPVDACPEAHMKMMEMGVLMFRSRQHKKLMREGLWFLSELIKKYRPTRRYRRKKWRQEEEGTGVRGDTVLVKDDNTEINMEQAVTRGDGIEVVSNREQSHQEVIVNEENIASWKRTDVDGASLDSEMAESKLLKDNTVGHNKSVVKENLEQSTQMDPKNQHNAESRIAEIAEHDDDTGDLSEAHESAEFLSLVVNLFSLSKVLLSRGQDLVYIAAVAIPSCFKESRDRSLATRVFGVASAGVAISRYSAFQFFFEIKKLMESIGPLHGLSPAEKLQLLHYMLETMLTVFESGKKAPDLISSGLPLIIKLGAPDDSADANLLSNFCDLSTQLLNRFVLDRGHHQSLSLLMLNTDFDFLRGRFAAHADGIVHVFHDMIRKARRQDVYALHRMCKPELEHPMYINIVRSLVNDWTGNMKRLNAVSTAVSACFSVQKDFATYTFIEPLVIKVVKEFEENFLANRISTENISAATDQFLLVSLFRIISEGDENNVNDGNAINYSPENIHDLFMTRFPPEVISDRETVHVLGLGVSRIENLDITRYKPVKTYAKEIINEYLSNQLPIDSALSAPDRLAYRNHHVHSFIASHPNNRSLRNRLINAGYHPVLFDDVQLSLYVMDVPLGNAETSYRTALRDCFQYLVLRMLRLARCDTVTLGDGTSMDVAKLFGAEDSVYELKSKRALAMRAVDQVLRQKEVPELLDAKFELLAREDGIEASYESQKSIMLVKRDALKNLTVRVETSFFGCLSSCPDTIAGCYAPKGGHCERPLEIGFRCDSLIIRILDDSDGVVKEIENTEAIMTDEGLYIYKAYTNGHLFDTSKVWLSIFQNLLSPPQNVEPKTPYVPAIILPSRFPDLRTFSLILGAGIKPVLVSSTLNVRKDFFTEMTSYYDYAPEKIRAGEDIVLVPESLDAVVEVCSSSKGFSHEATSTTANILPLDPLLPTNSELMQPQPMTPSAKPPPQAPMSSSNPPLVAETTAKDYAAQSRFHNQDLAGRIFTLLVQYHIRRSPALSALLPIGHLISAVVSDLCVRGSVDDAKFAEAFDYERWKARAAATGSTHVRAKDTCLDLDRGIVPSETQIKDEEEQLGRLNTKETTASFIIELTSSHVSTWIRTIDVDALFFDNRGHFHELMNYLDLVLNSDQLQSKEHARLLFKASIRALEALLRDLSCLWLNGFH
ncbi:hypothetical protein BC937DRAFT_89494 [Endogone sp. FLAS-F59071]|nr:hypothetical protein BC937DRAFT_89494 [Endogone sp. FLAS-F59071]|eukprot:RUS22374.1 hypothetical protein BC937DRAFT_89494 [Endogone sp. FLAS-F59071]